MGDELQHQGFRRRLGQGLCGRGPGTGSEVAEIRGERPQGVGSHAGFDEVLEAGGVLVGEERREPLAGVEGQDAGERVELGFASEERIVGRGQGRRLGDGVRKGAVLGGGGRFCCPPERIPEALSMIIDNEIYR